MQFTGEEDSSDDDSGSGSINVWKDVMGYGFHQTTDESRVTTALALSDPAQKDAHPIFNDFENLVPAGNCLDKKVSLDMPVLNMPRVVSVPAEFAKENLLFTVSPWDMQMPEEDCVKFFKLVEKHGEYGSGQVVVQRSGYHGDQLACFLLSAPMLSSLPKSRRAKSNFQRMQHGLQPMHRAKRRPKKTS